MKVAYFLDVPSGLGGAGNLLLQQAVLMSELYDAIIVIPEDEDGNYNYEYARRCERYNISYRHIQYNTAFQFSMIDFAGAIKSAHDIEEFALEEKIVFFHSVQLNIAVEYVSRKLRIPHLMDIYQLQESEFKIYFGDIYPQYHLCDSVLYSKCWNRQLGITSRCIRPVAPLDYIKRKNGYPKEKLKVLMLGNVCPRKNQMAAIKAVEECGKSSKLLELHIAGSMDDDYADKCRMYVRDKKMDHSIVFYGFVNDVSPLLESCDCLLCASYDESFPSSIVEALTYGLTIVSTPVAGVPEVFLDLKNSFISKGFSAESICRSLLDCVAFYETGKIEGIHKNAEKTWTEHFERGLVRKQIDLYYKEILANVFYKNMQPFFKAEKEVQEIVALLEGMDVGGEKWIHQRYLYYAFIRKRLHSGSIYIWGTGKLGKLAVNILERICPKLRVKAFVDTYRTGFCLGKKIIRFDDISVQEKEFLSISFWKNKESIVSILEGKGIRLNEQLWMIP